MLQAILGGKKTVDGVLGAFHKAINELEEVRQNNLNEVDAKTIEIEQAIAEREAAALEAKRADAVMPKLTSIVSGDTLGAVHA